MKKCSSYLLVLGLAFLHFSCGKDNKEADDVEVKNLAWVDEDAKLHPATSLAFTGEVSGNTDFAVSFKITDTKGNELKQTAQALHILSVNPPSEKKSLSLQSDMGTKVSAGQEVCSGDYTLYVVVKGGKATVSKPLNFTVVGGKNSSECAQPNLTSDIRKGAIHNSQGKEPGAFDLLSGLSISSKDTNSKKDLVDLSIAGRGFKMTLASGNGALFVQVPNEFSSLTLDQAKQLFQAGTQQSETQVLNGNEVFIVKLGRDNGAFYAVKINFVDKNSGSSRRNNGVITFSYRKLSITAVS